MVNFVKTFTPYQPPFLYTMRSPSQRHLRLPGSLPDDIFSTGSKALYFMRRTGGSGLTFTHLYDTPVLLRDYGYLMEHFDMGYTSLEICERVLLYSGAENTWTRLPGGSIDVDKFYSDLSFIVIPSVRGSVESYGYTESGEWGLLRSVGDARRRTAQMPGAADGYFLIAAVLENIAWH